MKFVFRWVVEQINKVYLCLSHCNAVIKNNSFFFVGISIEPHNEVIFLKSRIKRSKIIIKGVSNELVFDSVTISKTIISVNGSNNKIHIDPDVKLNNAVIDLRGNDCSIFIGKGTVFLGIRMVNVGKSNMIKIGKECLFSDQIELWASDTHSIFNGNREKVNPEKPVIIGDRVWVGSRVIILKGVTIHNDSVIGMGSVVTRDVSPHTVCVGSPNRTIKENITWKLEY